MQTLHLPQAPDLPLAFASSHNGYNFPGDMRPAAPPEALATSWDVVVDELSGHAPGCGGTPLEAYFPRCNSHANRRRPNLEPALLDAP